MHNVLSDFSITEASVDTNEGGRSTANRPLFDGQFSKRFAISEETHGKAPWKLFAAIAVLAIVLLPRIGHQRAAAQSAGMFVNTVDIEIVPSEIENFLALIKEDAVAAVKEPGCREFNVMVLVNNPNHVFLFEVYDSEAALRAHLASDNYKKYFAAAAKMMVKRNIRPMNSIAMHSKGQ